MELEDNESDGSVSDETIINIFNDESLFESKKETTIKNVENICEERHIVIEEYDDTLECCVCFEPFDNYKLKVKELKCHGDKVCQECISETETCPLCRADHALYGTYLNGSKIKIICRTIWVIGLSVLVLYGLLIFFSVMVFTTKLDQVECKYVKQKSVFNHHYNMCSLTFGSIESKPEKCNQKLLKEKNVQCYKYCRNGLTSRTCHVTLDKTALQFNQSKFSPGFLVSCILSTIITVISCFFLFRMKYTHFENRLYCRIFYMVCCFCSINRHDNDYVPITFQINQEINQEINQVNYELDVIN
jgi:hypothetical protein